ncbi:MAG: hypothetical protein K0R82_2996 [Flavipsychrobacter sp.]|jgi:hypothetical protein|nr:hypothetical protein [Flavipsychrobacter sp.]
MITVRVVKTVVMKKIAYSLGCFALCLALSACGGGDTGEGYNSNEKDDFNTSSNAGLTDSAVMPAAGDRGHPDSSINATPQGTGPDTGMTNVNRSGAR